MNTGPRGQSVYQLSGLEYQRSRFLSADLSLDRRKLGGIILQLIAYMIGGVISHYSKSLAGSTDLSGNLACDSCHEADKDLIIGLEDLEA